MCIRDRYLQADELVAGVNAQVTYTGGVLKLSQATLDLSLIHI